MSWSQVSLPKRRALAWLAALAVAGAASSPGGPLPPPFVAQAVAGAALAGEGQLRFFGLRIYDARLWVEPRFEAEAFDAHPLALELSYHRAFSGAAIAQRSVEEIRRQRPLEAGQAGRWQAELARLIPDVQPGDRLTGLYQPGQGLRLWRGSQALGAIEDAELARLFVGIWLSPRTSEPGLRSALLGRSPGAAP